MEKDNEELMLSKIGASEYAWHRIDDKYKNSKDFIAKALKVNPFLWDYLGRTQKEYFVNDKEIAKHVCATSFKGINTLGAEPFIKDFSDEIKEDREIALIAVSSHAKSLQYISPKLANDESFLLEVIKKNVEVYPYCQERKNNKDFIVKAIKANVKVFEYLPKELLGDKEILQARDSSQPEITEIAEVASSWWTSRIGSLRQNNGNDFASMLLSMKADLTKPVGQDAVEKFKQLLKEEIVFHLTHSDEQLHLTTDYGAEGKLACVAMDAKISTDAFPCKTVMWVRKDGVEVSEGYRGDIKVLYKTENPNENEDDGVSI